MRYLLVTSSAVLGLLHSFPTVSATLGTSVAREKLVEFQDDARNALFDIHDMPPLVLHNDIEGRDLAAATPFYGELVETNAIEDDASGRNLETLSDLVAPSSNDGRFYSK
jgi:hypothetical protein